MEISISNSIERVPQSKAPDNQTNRQVQKRYSLLLCFLSLFYVYWNVDDCRKAKEWPEWPEWPWLHISWGSQNFQVIWFRCLNISKFAPRQTISDQNKNLTRLPQAIYGYIEPKNRLKVLQFLFVFSFESRQRPSLTHDINKFDNKTMGGVLTFYRDSGRGRGNIFSSE